MDNPDHISQIFDDITESLRLKFRGWEQDHPHPGEQGGIRERRVADFLRGYLPGRYGIGSGHIIDQQGNISGQIDIVVYDAIDGQILPIDAYYSLFPCESVYAVIEVKSTLSASGGSGNGGTIMQCIDVATKVKGLHFDPENYEDGIPCFVFSYRSSWQNDVEKTMEWFNKLALKHDKVLPDVAYVLDSGFLLCRYHDRMYTHVYAKAPLLKFVSEMVDRMQRVSVSKPDLWNRYIDWKDTDIIAKIYEWKIT